jgi:hypothetical protein
MTYSPLRWPQQPDVDRKLLLLDDRKQGPGQRTKPHIALVRAGGHQQEIDAVPRQALMQRRGIVLLAELPFDDTVVRECPGLRVAQCLPGPGQDAGVIGRDLERQVLKPGTLGVV